MEDLRCLKRDTLVITADGQLKSHMGDHLGSCGSFNAAAAYCQKTGWDYVALNDLPLPEEQAA